MPARRMTIAAHLFPPAFPATKRVSAVALAMQDPVWRCPMASKLHHTTHLGPRGRILGPAASAATLFALSGAMGCVVRPAVVATHEHHETVTAEVVDEPSTTFHTVLAPYGAWIVSPV